MSNIRILTIDDEKQIRKFLKIALNAEGFEVIEAATLSEGFDAVVKQKPEIILLDLNLPDGYGLDLLKRIREFTEVPVIVLSVKDKEADKIELLEAGADDYITKPFGMGELLARIRVLLRRNTAIANQPNFTAGDLTIDYTKREVYVKALRIHLTPTEYNLLCLLAKNVGKGVTTHQIMREIWGPGLAAETGYLRVYVAALRKKIKEGSKFSPLIENEPGVGYRLSYTEGN